MQVLDFWVGALCLIAVIASGVSLWISVRAGSVTSLRGQVRQLDLDLHELFDTVEKWTRRDRVRRFRDGQEAALMKPQVPDRTDRSAYKAYLRRQATPPSQLPAG